MRDQRVIEALDRVASVAWRQLESVARQSEPGDSQLGMAGLRRHGTREMRSSRPGKNQHSCHHLYSSMTLTGRCKFESSL